VAAQVVRCNSARPTLAKVHVKQSQEKAIFFKQNCSLFLTIAVMIMSRPASAEEQPAKATEWFESSPTELSDTQ
jgi:hypothetical protein